MIEIAIILFNLILDARIVIDYETIINLWVKVLKYRTGIIIFVSYSHFLHLIIVNSIKQEKDYKFIRTINLSEYYSTSYRLNEKINSNL